MSILIKDMEMPKNCFDCMFHWHGDGTTYCLAQSKMHDLHHIKWQCNGYEEQMKYRELTCPLVPVPPHCRLIDADSVEKQIDYVANLDWNRKVGASVGMFAALEIVEDALTIIESEGE